MTGTPKARVVRRRMRWAATFLGSATVLGIGWVMHGGYEFIGLTLLGYVIQALAILFAVLGLIACIGALVAGFSFPAKRTALVIGIGVIAIIVVLVSILLFPPVALLGVPLIIATIIIGASGDSGSAMAQPLRTWRRVVLALIFTMLTLVIVAAGVLHITVWNPLAKVPGLSLDEIYAAMAAANESPFVFLVAAWAIFWGVAAVIFAVLAGLPALRTFFTARRIAVTGLLLVGATAGFHTFAGFNMGMSLADTFAISGGDAAIGGIVIAIVGQFALVAALLIGLPPRRHRGEQAGPDAGAFTDAGVDAGTDAGTDAINTAVTAE